MATVTAGTGQIWMDLSSFWPQSESDYVNVVAATNSVLYAEFFYAGSNYAVVYNGSFSYDGFGDLAGGTINSIQVYFAGALNFTLSGISEVGLDFSEQHLGRRRSFQYVR